MITGIDFSSWSTIKDIQAVASGQTLVDFAWVRVNHGYGDDQKWTQHRNLIKTARTANGSVLWGAYMFLGYDGSIGSQTWNADGGAKQATSAWALLTAGGADHNLPLAIDAERVRWWDGKAYQLLPLPSASEYCSAYLSPAIVRATALQGRRPVIYTSPDIILNYLAPVLPAHPEITACPLWVAAWNKTGTAPNYWNDWKDANGNTRKGVKNYWSSWLAWQYAGDVRDWPGIDDVDLNRIPGTRAQLKAWLKDPAAPMPAEGAPDPIDPPIEPPTSGDILARVKALEEWQKAVRAA